MVFAAAALPCACLNVSVGYLGSLSSVAPDAVESFALFQLAVADAGALYTYSAAADRCLSCAGNKAPNWLFAAAASVAFLAAFAFVVVRRDEGADADDAARNRLRLAFKLRSKWRILFVALQILTMYPAILSSVRYPKVYTELIGPFRVLGLDIPALLPLSCLTAGTFDYFASLRFMTLGPLLLVVAYAVLFEAHARLPTNRLLALAGRERNATISLMPVFQFTLFASFCIFPPTSLAIFKCFRCDEVSDGARGVWYLAADYSIRCGGAAYAANMAYACAMVAVYPLGVPLLYATMLYRSRAGLDPVLGDGARARRRRDGGKARVAAANELRLASEELKRTAVLWGPYEPEFYAWETWEALRRLLSTSVTMLFFPRQPGLQIAFSVVVVLVSLKMYVTFKPFAQDDDDRLAELLCWILLLTQLALLVLVAQDYRGSAPVGATMCALLAAALLSGLYLVVVDVKRERRVLDEILVAHEEWFKQYARLARGSALLRSLNGSSFGFGHHPRAKRADTADLDGRKSGDLATLLRRAVGAPDAAPERDGKGDALSGETADGDDGDADCACVALSPAASPRFVDVDVDRP